MTRTLFAGILMIACGAAFAGESAFKLKQAPGVEQVRANCSACHSVDYIQLNSPFLDRKTWEAEVTKMIKAFGAPVKSEDIAPIVDYLTRNYGKQ